MDYRKESQSREDVYAKGVSKIGATLAASVRQQPRRHGTGRIGMAPVASA